MNFRFELATVSDPRFDTRFDKSGRDWQVQWLLRYAFERLTSGSDDEEADRPADDDKSPFDRLPGQRVWINDFFRAIHGSGEQWAKAHPDMSGYKECATASGAAKVLLEAVEKGFLKVYVEADPAELRKWIESEYEPDYLNNNRNTESGGTSVP